MCGACAAKAIAPNSTQQGEVQRGQQQEEEHEEVDDPEGAAAVASMMMVMMTALAVDGAGGGAHCQSNSADVCDVSDV